MIESLRRISDYIEGMRKEAFLADQKTIDAVVRNLEIVGEAAARLSHEAKQHGPTIEWSQIIGLRNRIVHEYFGVDTEIVWQIGRHDLPLLGERLRRLLDDLPSI
jgi:uncharacterized protein with HEPN domain